MKLTRRVEGTGNNAGIRQLVPVTAVREYTLAAYCHDDYYNVAGGVGMAWLAADTSYVGHSGTSYSDSTILTWQRVARTATAPAGAAYADCMLRCYGFTGRPAGGVIHFDDASLVEGAGAVEEPPGRFTAVPVSVRPNPAAGPVAVRFAAGRAGRVAVTVRDRAGRLVAPVIEAELGAGSHCLRLQAGLAPGAYFVRVSGAAQGLAKFVVR
ncbi:MAG: hypothetical protein R6X12_07700 [bacterium]